MKFYFTSIGQFGRGDVLFPSLERFSVCPSKFLTKFVYVSFVYQKLSPPKLYSFFFRAVKANILIAQERQKACYDRKHANPNIFVVGSMVLKKDFRRKKRAGGKLDPSWVGPYTIVKALGRGLYSLQGIVEPSKIISRINGIHLKRYYQVNFKSFIMHECGKCTLEFSIVFNLASSFVLTRNSSTTAI